MEWFSETFHLAYRQSWAISHALQTLGESLRGTSLKAILSAIVLMIQTFNFMVFETPLPATGQTLDLSGYSLVFSDEFDSDTLNTDVWRYRSVGARRAGFDAPSQVSLHDGVMEITAEYLKDGEYGEGWYTGNISLLQWYTRGYFEIRCKCADGGCFWSAFWLQSASSYNHEISAGGPGGAEIDIFEAMNGEDRTPIKHNAVTSTIHCNGWDEDPEKIDSRILGTFRGEDIYESYNTYGLEWTEDEYIFYINGVETTRSSFGNGVSEKPEEVIVSLESPDEIPLSPVETAHFTVDYVRIYQKN